jgi:hypothetical protein
MVAKDLVKIMIYVLLLAEINVYWTFYSFYDTTLEVSLVLKLPH